MSMQRETGWLHEHSYRKSSKKQLCSRNSCSLVLSFTQAASGFHRRLVTLQFPRDLLAKRRQTWSSLQDPPTAALSLPSLQSHF